MRRTTAFGSPEEMEAANEAAGYSIRYRQIQSGRTTMSVTAGQCADIKLLDECVTGRMEVLGTTPKGHVTVVVARDGKGVWLNGNVLHGPEIGLLGPGDEIHAISNDHANVLSMHIPTRLLRAMETPFFLNDDIQLPRGGAMVIPALASTDRMRGLMDAVIRGQDDSHCPVERASGLLTALAAIINECDHDGQDEKNSSQAERLRVIRHASEFIDAHLAEPIRIDELCMHCATSLSKLERTFRRELQISPSKYILARRLDAVNRELRHAKESNVMIATLAIDHGFSHLGRFAADYRHQFGELPSETLRSA